MAILETQIFSSDIAKNLHPSNAFYTNSKSDSAFVNDDKINLPQSGALPNTVVDRDIVPAQVKKRIDSAIDYPLQEISTDPFLIKDSEEVVLAYDKRMSVLEDHINTINDASADIAANNWFSNIVKGGADADKVFRTTGTDTRAAGAPGATGTRKRVILDDLIDIKIAMDKQDIPIENRIAVLPASWQGDILLIDQLTDAEKTGLGLSTLIPGSVTRFLGFNVFYRSRIGVYNVGATLSKGVGSLAAAEAADDNEAAMFYHPNFVRHAQGSVKVYNKIDDPTYYGSVFSAASRFGATRAREDNKGFFSLVEEA